jgi:glycosyltransferase involved in cell wall biosynthesis
MRVLIVTPSFLPRVDGSVRLVKNLAEGLIKKGHNVILVTSRLAGTPDYQVVDNISVFRATKWRSSLFGRFRFIFNTSVLIGRLSKHANFDVIHAFGASALLASIFGNIGRKRVITTFPGLPQELFVGGNADVGIKNASRTSLRFMALRSGTIVAPTNAAASQIRRMVGKRVGKRIVVIPNPVDIEKFRAMVSATQSSFYPEILCVGTLAFRKGFDIAIRSLPHILRNFSKARLTIVGRGPRYEELSQLANVLGLNQRVRLTDYLEDDQLVKLYDSCDIFILPSRAGGEAFGYAMVEAMAAGKAVIATETPGPGEILQRSKSGLLVKPDDEIELARAVIELAGDDRLRSELAKKGRVFVHNEFSVDAVTQLYERVYSGNER